MNVIKNGSTIIVVLNNGAVLQKNDCNEEFYDVLLEAVMKSSEEDVLMLMCPTYEKTHNEAIEKQKLLDRLSKQNMLTLFGNSVYWKEISDLSMPEDFVNKILDAVDNNDTDKLEAYKNFWTLLSLNPDSRCRANLFWYLNTWGMTISKSGLFVGYRNVKVKRQGDNLYCDKALAEFVKTTYEKIKKQKKGPGNFYIYRQPGSCGLPNFYVCKKDTELYNEIMQEKTEVWNVKGMYEELALVNFDYTRLGSDTIYTDMYSGTTTIQIGRITSISRESCDTSQEHQCSSGLHLANAEWLTRGYYGDVGLTCLCNPADVVCVPRDSTYGKLRTCAYLPIALTEYDKDGNVIPYTTEDGFDSHWVKTVLYDGIVASEASPEYHIVIPDTPEIKKPEITMAVLDIARKFINERNL